MQKKDKLEYEYEYELASGANLKTHIFSNTEHRWIFTHKFVSPEKRERLENPTLINDTKLIVNYDKGITQDCNLTMDIIFPNRRGKEYFLGVDISKDSHLFVEFIYEKQGDLYRMKTVDFGVNKRIELDTLEKGLVKPVDFPFPLKDRVENEFGVYKIPFLKNNDEEAFFEFPSDYSKKF